MIFIYLGILVLLFIFAIFYVVQFYNIIFRGFAPYINTNHKTIHTIISNLDIKGDETIYELGCASAGFLQTLAKSYPKTKLVGVEYSFLPYLIGKIQIKLQNIKNISLLRRNIFNIDLHDANIIYCYLNIKTMQKLKGKFKKECQSNTRIISNKFHIPNWTEEKLININEEKIYIYKV